MKIKVKSSGFSNPIGYDEAGIIKFDPNPKLKEITLQMDVINESKLCALTATSENYIMTVDFMPMIAEIIKWVKENQNCSNVDPECSHNSI